MTDAEDDPLEVFMAGFEQADPGQLLEAAAAYHPGTAEHEAAWSEVRAAAVARGLADEVDRLRRRVARWATQGSDVTFGHMGAGPTDELLRSARVAAAGAVIDAGVVALLDADLDPATVAVLLRPLGRAELGDDAVTADRVDPGPTAG